MIGLFLHEALGFRLRTPFFYALLLLLIPAGWLCGGVSRGGVQCRPRPRAPYVDNIGTRDTVSMETTPRTQLTSSNQL